MIYKSSYKKYIRQENLSAGGLTFIRRLLWVFAAAGLAIAAHFVLQLVAAGKTIEALPEYMYASLFGNLYIYVVLFMLLCTIFLLINPNSVSFPELHNNRWYLYTRMGLAPAAMAKAKINSTLFAVSGIYTLGYLVVLAFCVLFGVAFVVNYLFSLYFAGLVYLLLVLVLTMGISVFLRPGALPRLALLLATAAGQYLLYSGGFYGYQQSTVFTQRIASMFTLGGANLLVVFCGVTILCHILIVLQVGKKALTSNEGQFDPHQVAGGWTRSADEGYAGEDAPADTPRPGYSDTAARRDSFPEGYTASQIIPREDDDADDEYSGYRSARYDGEKKKGVALLIVGAVVFSLLTLAFGFVSVMVLVPSLLSGPLGQGVFGALGLGEGAIRMLSVFSESLWSKVGVVVCTLLLLTVVILLFVMIKKRRNKDA